MPKRKRGRPKKIKIPTEPTSAIKPSSEDARESLEEIIAYFRKKVSERGLIDDEIKSLTTVVDSLIKLGKEERVIAEKYRKLSDNDIIKLAKKAARKLKKKDTVMTE